MNVDIRGSRATGQAAEVGITSYFQALCIFLGDSGGLLCLAQAGAGCEVLPREPQRPGASLCLQASGGPPDAAFHTGRWAQRQILVTATQHR